MDFKLVNDMCYARKVVLLFVCTSDQHNYDVGILTPEAWYSMIKLDS